MKGNKKKWTASSVVLLLVGIAMVAVALGMLIPTLLDYKKSNDTYNALVADYVSVDIDTEAIKTDAALAANWWFEEVSIDLEELQEINSDIIGWIRFDNIEKINYPILYSGDDETYLRTDIYGNSTTAGCIFMEGLNNPDFMDSHTIIYGHNMKNMSMFGSLKKYKTDGFYEENQYFTIYTNDMAYRYQIFSYRDVSEISSVYSVGFGAGEQFQEFVNDMIRQSYMDTDVSVTGTDKVVTLSTCSSEGNRFVVHAVMVDAKPYE